MECALLWTPLDTHQVFSGAPVLLLPLDEIPDEFAATLETGHALSGRALPDIAPFAFYCADESLGLCRMQAGQDHSAQRLYIDSFGDEDFGLPDISPSWKEAAISTGNIVVCAYIDVFLASYIGEHDDCHGLQFLHLIENSHLGVGRVLSVS
jgi:hypothetical protein